jgi:hypothetical protein
LAVGDICGHTSDAATRAAIDGLTSARAVSRTSV